VSLCPISGDVIFEHLGRVESAQFLHYKVTTLFVSILSSLEASQMIYRDTVSFRRWNLILLAFSVG